MAVKLLLFVALISSSLATVIGSCVNNTDGACSSVRSNQLTLNRVKEDIYNVSQDLSSRILDSVDDIEELLHLLYSNTPEERAKLDELNACRNESADRESEMGKLIEQNKNATQHHLKQENVKKKARQELEDLRKVKEDLEADLKRMKEEIPIMEERVAKLTVVAHVPMDCADHQIKGETVNGVYTIHPYQNETTVDVQCDFHSNGGAWTVVFTRMPTDEPLDFNARWVDFKHGFGNASTEFWMGNDFLHALTSYGLTSLRLDITNFTDVHHYGEWDTFHVASEEEKYKLTIAGFSGNLGNSLDQNNNQKFTTYDQDNDIYPSVNCAVGTRYRTMGDGAWWYKKCGHCRPTAPLSSVLSWESAVWLKWEPDSKKLTSIKTFAMKLRRHNYQELSRVGPPEGLVGPQAS